MGTIEITIPADPRYLKILRCGIEHICALCRFPGKERPAIVRAVDEAAANIIRHAYGGPSDRPIIIRIHIREDRLEIVLRDFGIKADPDKIRSRSLEDVRPGGLGVHLIHSAMDSVEYDTTVEKGNRLILIKYFPNRKKAEDDKR